MKKQWKVLRTHISEYQAIGFKDKEKQLLENIDSVSYVSSWEDNPNILIVNTHTVLEDLPPNKLKDVELIIHPNSGYDRYTVQFIKEFAKPIIVGNSIRAQAVAQYTASCLFHHFASPPFDCTWDKSRNWNRKLLSELSIQLIGFGRIGKLVHDSLIPFGVSFSIYDPYIGKEDLNIENADVIVMASSLNSENSSFLDSQKFSKMKKDIVIINGARGKLIDQESLLNFLRENHEAYAYLDVFESEPFEAVDFENFANLALTSHCAGVFNELDSEIIQFESKVISSFIIDQNFIETYRNSNLVNRIQDGVLI